MYDWRIIYVVGTGKQSGYVDMKGYDTAKQAVAAWNAPNNVTTFSIIRSAESA